MSIYKDMFLPEALRIYDELVAEGLDELRASELAYSIAMLNATEEHTKSRLQSMPSASNAFH